MWYEQIWKDEAFDFWSLSWTDVRCGINGETTKLPPHSLLIHCFLKSYGIWILKIGNCSNRTGTLLSLSYLTRDTDAMPLGMFSKNPCHPKSIQVWPYSIKGLSTYITCHTFNECELEVQFKVKFTQCRIASSIFSRLFSRGISLITLVIAGMFVYKKRIIVIMRHTILYLTWSSRVVRVWTYTRSKYALWFLL